MATKLPTATATLDYRLPTVNPAQFCTPEPGQVCLNFDPVPPPKQDILAHILVAEASILDASGMANVAQIIRNRTKHPDYPSDPVSVVTQSTSNPQTRNDFTFVGIAMPAPHTGTFWDYGLELADSLLSGVDLIPGASPAVQNSNVIYYCATDIATAESSANVHIDYGPPGTGIAQIYRTAEMGPCR